MEALNDWKPNSHREMILTREANFIEGLGLEIGALHNPIIPQKHGIMHFVDYADSSTLKKVHAHNPDWVAGMVEVDHVWSGSGSLVEVVGGREIYDFVIASHVIEHVPNLVGWFAGIFEVMKPGAVFNLALPDKRFTFDIDCPESTVGQLVEAHLLNYTSPSIRQMFDHCYYAKAIEPGEIWNNRIEVDKVPAYTGEIAPDLAMAQAIKISKQGSYIDSHCWIFTPLSFLELLHGLVRLNLFPFIPESFMPTSVGGFEFYLSLRKPTKGDLDITERQRHAINGMRGELELNRRNSLLISGS